MIRLLWQFWPVLLPLLAYALWVARQRRRARKDDSPLPRWQEGPWFWTLIAMAAMAIACFLWWGLSAQTLQGHYAPPRLEGGRVVPGEVSPRP